LHALETGALVGKGFLLLGMSVFFVLLVFGLVYEWKKGAFEWD
jgi:NADH:ubiquinone oxidoreductase subunit 3 (subunit A)